MKRTLLLLLIAAMVGCGKKDRRAGQVDAPAYAGGPAKTEVKEEDQRQPLPWVVQRPSTDQKPIHDLPLKIEIDAPEVPEKVAELAPVEQ